MNPYEPPNEQGIKKRRRRKPWIPNFMKPVMVIIVGLTVGFGAVQTLIVLLRSR